jgi:hypothetical protein
MGHSAGATHVASYVSHPEFFGVAAAPAYGSSWDMSAMSLGGITAGDFSRRNKGLPVVLQV